MNLAVSMKEGRPYLVNYALGIIFVMSVHLLFNGVAALAFPELFNTSWYKGEFFQVLFIGVGIVEMIMFVSLYIGSGIAYKFTLLLLMGILAATVIYISWKEDFAFDITIQSVLSVVCLVLLLTPRVRRYYKNWSLGELPSFEL